MPLIPTKYMQSKTYNRSIEFRTRQLWNNLPKTWVLKELNYSTFCELVKQHLILNDNCDFVS